MPIHARPVVYLSNYFELEPGIHFPKDLPLQRINNNLDVVCFEDTYYLALRTSKFHQSNAHTWLHILRSSDGMKWQHDHTIFRGRDIREPRFLVMGKNLFLYYLTAAPILTDLSPEHTWMIQKTKNGWTRPESIFEKGYIFWRFRTKNEHEAYAIGYYGKDMFRRRGRWDSRLIKSTDGKVWHDALGAPLFSMPGANEVEFDFNKKGEMFGVIRVEGVRSFAFKTEPHHFSSCTLRPSEYKHDSALLFTHLKNTYLLSRRDLAGGVFDYPRAFPRRAKMLLRMLGRSFSKKRTSLFSFNQDTLEIEHLSDVVGKGDTAFPAVVPIEKRKKLIFNYSSAMNTKRDYPWLYGTFRPSKIYAQIFRTD